MDEQVKPGTGSPVSDASFQLGMHTEQLGGRSQQMFFSAEDGENFLYPDGPDLDFNKRTEFDATLTRKSVTLPNKVSARSSSRIRVRNIPSGSASYIVFAFISKARSAISAAGWWTGPTSG